MTSNEVAKRAGVSRTTVSFVLNDVPNVQIPEETRQRVLQAARELNYYPDAAARSLASRKAQTIGLVLCQTRERVYADAFLPEVIAGIGDAIEKHNFRVLIQPVEDVTQPDAYSRIVGEKRIDGIVLSGPRSDDRQLGKLVNDGFPIVLLGQLDAYPVSFVDIDNVASAKMAVEHLINLGHRRIGMITNASPLYTASADRLKGYRNALQAAGFPFEECLVNYGDFTSQGGYTAMASLLTQPNVPSAVFVASDVVAFGALAAIKERDLRVPDDMALVGFDDIPLAHYADPPLTTVHLPAYDLGHGAGEVVMQLINGRTAEPRQILLSTSLKIRESCGYRGH